MHRDPPASDSNQEYGEGSGAAVGHLAPGLLLSNRYEVVRQLGAGGYGAVYLARDRQLNSRTVVVKVLLGGALQSAWAVNKFRQEIEALTRLDHPGIVGIFDAGQLPGGPHYLVMQYIEGDNLRSAITAEGMDLGRAAHIVRQVGRALSAAHDRGVFHRDLKPENVMLQTLGGEEQVKVIDFGIAKVRDSLVTPAVSTELMPGTVFYMSPEQLARTPVTRASDTYALGIIAYEMVTGRRPFNPESVFQMLEMQRAGVRVKPKDLRPSLPEPAQESILKALSFDPGGRHALTSDFGEELARALADGGGTEPAPGADSEQARAAGTPLPRLLVAKAEKKRVAILYKRNAQPDEQILQLLERALLAGGHQVFIDRHLSIGVEWAQEIERQVRTADAVIPLLSATSVGSEVLAYEVQTACDAAQKQGGRPRLLPVRINYEGRLPDALAPALDPLQYAVWTSSHDNERLAAELLDSLEREGQPPVDLRKFESVGGAVPLDSKFYIVRPTDYEFLSAIERRDSIVLVKGARQMGKTSLLARGINQARGMGSKVVLTDFQGLNAAHFESVETLYLTLAEVIADQLDLEVEPGRAWSAERGPSVNFQRFIRREVLAKLDQPLVWGLDEVDRLFTCPFGSEVFGLFRSWHNARSLDPEGPWCKLTMAIAYATEAHLFISDLNQSPFNVGTRLSLDDFTLEQVAELNRRHDSPLKDPAQVAAFYGLLSGHPYLVRKGLHELASHRVDLVTFQKQADLDEGPFGDHLRRFLVLLAQDKALCEVVREILRGRPCPSVESFYRLRSAGLLAGESAQEARPRCQLYALYLSRHLL